MKKIIILTFLIPFIAFTQKTTSLNEKLINSNSIKKYLKRENSIRQVIDNEVFNQTKNINIDTLIMNYHLFIDTKGKIYVSSNNINDVEASKTFEQIMASTIYSIQPFVNKNNNPFNFKAYHYHHYSKNDNGDYVKFTPKKDKKAIITAAKYPKCNGNNKKLKKCFYKSINNHIKSNFDFELVKKINLPLGVHRIFSNFTLNKQGNIENIKVRTEDNFIKDEVLRVLNLLPKIQPVLKNGIPKETKVVVPISFKIE